MYMVSRGADVLSLLHNQKSLFVKIFQPISSAESSIIVTIELTHANLPFQLAVIQSLDPPSQLPFPEKVAAI